MVLQIDSVWGWASPPLRLQLAGGTRGASGRTAAGAPSSQRMGEIVVERAPSPARLSHTSEKHPRATLTELNVLRRHRELCDVVLNVGSRKIFAHRVILSACSPYFRYNGTSLINIVLVFKHMQRIALSYNVFYISLFFQGNVYWGAGGI